MRDGAGLDPASLNGAAAHSKTLGNYLWVSTDGDGRSWHEYDLSFQHNRNARARWRFDQRINSSAGEHGLWATQSYNSLLSLGPRSALVAYGGCVPALANPGPLGAVLDIRRRSVVCDARAFLKGCSKKYIVVRSGARLTKRHNRCVLLALLAWNASQQFLIASNTLPASRFETAITKSASPATTVIVISE